VPCPDTENGFPGRRICASSPETYQVEGDGDYAGQALKGSDEINKDDGELKDEDTKL
jgi:hypothetical protein